MATGRTLPKWDRVYVDGYDISGMARSVGPMSLVYGAADLTALSNPVKGYLPAALDVNVGAVNSVFDNTATTGIHALFSTAGVKRTVMVARGIRGEPAAGDDCFGGQFAQGDYVTADDGGGVVANLPFSGWAADATSLLYASPWGQLLHANSAATGANTATGHDNYTGGATTKGGWLLYQVLASSGGAHTATISVDDSADNITFGALSGATTGVITVTAGVSGIVAIGNTATVKRYLRWQLALGTATSVTFALSFHRG